MLNKYYAAFIPGLQDFFTGIIKKRLSDVKILKLLDGAVLFETETTYDKLNFFCFNNIFAVVNTIDVPLEDMQRQGVNALENHIRLINNYISQKIQSSTECKRDIKSMALCNSAVNLETIINNNKKFNTFRIVVSNENIPASINEKLRADIEMRISQISGLKADRALPDTEFWFLFRKVEERGESDFLIFMKRLTIRPSWEKTLHKGELPPPLAWTLCSLADLKHSDTVLDPFCGYGSIPQSAAKHFHITKFFACENNSAAACYTAKKLIGKKGFILHKLDFFDLVNEDKLEKSSIDAIVTDPPWGQYRGKLHQQHSGLDNGFYKKMLDAFDLLLKDGGTAVILCAKNDDFQNAIPVSFEITKKIPILLSGKKTIIYIFKKLLVR